MYALAFFPEEGDADRDLATLDRKIRDWLGENGDPGTWDTAWTFSNKSCPTIPDWVARRCVRALITDDDAAMLKLQWDGKVETIGCYPESMMLSDLNLGKTGYHELQDFMHCEQHTNRMWTDGIILYYTSEDDLVLLKLRFSRSDD